MRAEAAQQPSPNRTHLEPLDWIVSRRVHEYLDEAGEAMSLAQIERHLDAVAAVHERHSIESALTPETLSRLCGRTLRDWNAVNSGGQ